MAAVHAPQPRPSEVSRDVSEGLSEYSWTIAEWDRLLESGVLDGRRVELIEGRILQMAPQKVPHTVALELVNEYVRAAFGAGHRFRIQMPLRTADGSEPEPDCAVVAGDPRTAPREHPTTALLVVEVSETTLRHDRRKGRQYASSGVADYWILNLTDRTLEIHREPLAGGGTPAGPAYANITVHQVDQIVAPLAAPQATVKVADLLP